MTDLTDEAVKSLLAHYDLPTDCDCDGDDCVKCSHYPTFQERASKQLKDAAPDLARALLDTRAEHAASLIRINAEAVEAVAQARADAQAAVALALEEAAENKEQLEIWAHEILAGLAFADVLKIDSYNDKIEAHDMVGRGLVEVIRALAPADGLAAVDALRAEIADLKMNMDADLRTMVREGQQLRTLAAELAQARADTVDIVRNVWGRCEALEDEAADKLAQLEKLTDHEKGFWRGQKTVAKSIRRSTEMPTAEAIAIRRAEGGKA